MYRELMTQPDKLNVQLEEFLREHPIYSWMSQLRLGKFPEASLTLFGEAERETMNIDRRKTLFSLCKLSLLSSSPSSNSDLLAACNQHITLIDAQKNFSNVLQVSSFRLSLLLPSFDISQQRSTMN